jgi:branched-chain amino acid transport system permease protein
MGIVLILQTTNVMNFAQGDTGMFVAYLAFFMLSSAKVPYALVLVLAIAAGAVIGLVVERFMMRSVRSRSHLSLIMLTLGLSLVFQGLAAFLFNTEPRLFPPLVTGDPVKLGPIILSRQDIVVLLAAIIVFGVLYLLLYRTKQGTAARSISQDEYAARVLGIPTPSIYMLVWAVGSALAGLAALLIVPKFSLEPSFMSGIQVKAFTAIVLGGMNSVFGAAVGGLIIGVVENIVAYQFPAIKDSFMLIVVVIVLLVMPQGLFGRRQQRRF